MLECPLVQNEASWSLVFADSCSRFLALIP